MLRSIQINILSLEITLKKSMFPSLRNILVSQLHELEYVSTELFFTASRNGWDLNNLDPAFKCYHFMRSQLHLYFQTSSSQIAAFIIQGNITAMNNALCATQYASGINFYTNILIQKFLDCETASIRRLKHFL